MVAAVLLWEALPTLSAHAETTIVPSALVRSRFDSNVYRTPVQLLAPGTQPQDFVTTVGGGLDLIHKTRDIEADVRMGGTFNALAVNSNRNYFAALLRASVGLDNWVDQYVRGAKLIVGENLRYSPTLPAFLAGARDLPEDDSLIRGFQGFRANTLYNTTNITGAYPLSRDISLEGGYVFGLRRVGNIQGEPGTPLSSLVYFNTMTNNWFGGPRYRLTRNDSVAALYKQIFISQERPGGSRTLNTNVITFAGEYSKTFQEWHLTMQGGVTFVEPGGQVFPTGSIQVSTRPERDTAVRLAVSREPRASFFILSGATISNIARLGVSHTIFERLILDGTIAYAYNQFLPNTAQTFQNLTATSKLAYKLTRNITGEIFALYQNVDNNTSSVQYQFSRYEAGFMLTTEWK